MTSRPSSSERGDAARRLGQLESACREQGLRLTPQRRALLETLVRHADHPSAEQLHTRIRRKLPDLSRATVFRILEQLVSKGIIGRACHPGRSARYDARTELHHHLVCLRCESMTDIFDESLDRLAIPDTTARSFNVVDFRVQLRGFCSKCQRHMKRKPDNTIGGSHVG